MAERAVCPACWHAETRRGRLNGYEPTRDDTQLMSWHVTPMSGGVWHCETCGVTLPPAAAGVLLDAALMASDPDSDSIGDDGVHADVHIALRGGYDD